MGKDKIRYLIFINGRWRWRPSKVMRAAGFQLTNLGPGKVVDGRRVASQEDKERALRLNAAWDCIRRGAEEFTVVAKAYPPGSVGEAWERIMQLRARERLDAGKSWTREQQSRDDWHRAWRHFGPLFGDTDPRTIRPEHFIGDPAKPDELGLKTLIARKVSDREAHRVIKVWLAFWKKMAALGYCDLDRDPSKLVRNSAAPPRQAMWREGEAVRLVKAAWRAGFESLAALLAVAWDSQLSPVDARSIKAHQMRRDAHGMWFDIARAKTGRSALATLSRRTEVVLGAYLGSFPAQPVGIATIFRNRSGQPYTKDTLGDDFRVVRELVFGSQEKRQMADFRRSGSVEALEGGASPHELQSKMANTLASSSSLYQTYSPNMLGTVRGVDVSRLRGRTLLREQNAVEIVTEAVSVTLSGKSRKLKSLK